MRSEVAPGGTMCSLRARRGQLRGVAREEGCQGVALGHHRDDILETFLLNRFFGGRPAAVRPKLLNDDGDLLVLRPLAHVAEADRERFSRAMGLPIIPYDPCGPQDGLRRQEVKRMLDGWERASPGRRGVMFRALGKARPSQPLDPGPWGLAALNPDDSPRIGMPALTRPSDSGA